MCIVTVPDCVNFRLRRMVIQDIYEEEDYEK